MAIDNDYQLNLPEQDLRRLTLGSANPKKLRAWVKALPPLNLGESARQLYQFLQEINRLHIDFPKRLAALEIILPSIIHVNEGLKKHYLNQPLVLPEKARKIASLAQALEGHLANGYKLVAIHGLRKIKDREARQQVALACYRATSSLTRALLRCYQLYFPIPSNLWLEIHQIYALAEDADLLDKTLPAADGQTPISAYLQALLLATARPNQLRQQETQLIYQATKQWSQWADIHSRQGREYLFATELNMDNGPVYGSQLSKHHDRCRYLDTRQLIQQLSHRPEDSELKLPKGMSSPLLTHLRQAWGSLAERSFKRISQHGTLELCLGLGAVHYFCSNEESFQHFLRNGEIDTFANGDSQNPFLASPGKAQKADDDDPWSHAFDPGSAITGDKINFSSFNASFIQTDEDTGTQFDSHAVAKINASPGGYCLSWAAETPMQLRAGELIALRDGHEEWAIGVIRWVRQMASSGAQFGVEIMAPRAQPCAARVLKKTGADASFMRALLLPALEAIGQPVSLLLPRVSFHAGQKVELIQGDEISRVQLVKQLSGSASYNLYQFHNAAAVNETEPASREAPPDSQDQFDSIWSNL